MKRYCLTLDLKEDPAVIEEYKKIHKNVWLDILERIKARWHNGNGYLQYR